jgi:hypothetical protein
MHGPHGSLTWLNNGNKIKTGPRLSTFKWMKYDEIQKTMELDENLELGSRSNRKTATN